MNLAEEAIGGVVLLIWILFMSDAPKWLGKEISAALAHRRKLRELKAQQEQLRLQQDDAWLRDQKTLGP